MCEIERLLKLTLLSRIIAEKGGVLISVYRNASGYLYNLEMSDGDTDLGYSKFSGNCENSGSFLSYNDALQDAVGLVQQYPFAKFVKLRKSSNNHHWSNYFITASEKIKKERNTLHKVDYSLVERAVFLPKQVEDMLVDERQRAVKIAYETRQTKLEQYESQVVAEAKVRGDDWQKKSLAFIKKEIAEEARLIGNCISGGNALSETLGETMRDRIKKQYKL